VRHGDGPATGAAAARYAFGVAGRVVAARRTGGRPGDALAHPASVGALLWLLTRSVIARRRGTLQWRGRPVALDGQARTAPSDADRPRGAAPAATDETGGRRRPAWPADGAGARHQQPLSPGGRAT
jgi:hypothetical protein